MGSRNKGIILSYTNTIFNMICGLFLSSFFVRVLGDTEYGVYKTISSFANYLVLLEFGTGTVMSRNLSICKSRNASEQEINRNVSTILSISGVLSLLILAVSVIFYFSIDSIYSNSMTAEQIQYSKQIFVFITAYLVISFASQTLNGITLAFERYSFGSVVAIIKNILRVGLLVGLLSAWKYSIIIAIVDMAISLALTIITYIYCTGKLKIKYRFKYFDKEIFKASLPLCFAIFLQAIVNQANNNVDQFILGVKIGPEIVTLYSISMYIYTVFSSLMTIPISMYVPQVTKNVVDGKEGKELTKTLIAPSRLIAFIGGLVLFGFIGFGRQFIEIVYGAEYMDAWIIAIIIMVPQFINMTSGVLVNVLNALDKRIARSLILILTTATNIILTIFFIDLWGAIGAAIATAICTVIGQIILANVYYKKAIKINVLYIYKESFKGILPYQALGAVGAIVIGMAISNVYLSLLVSAIAYLIVALGLYALLGMKKGERDFLKKIINRRGTKND